MKVKNNDFLKMCICINCCSPLHPVHMLSRNRFFSHLLPLMRTATPAEGLSYIPTPDIIKDNISNGI